MAVTCVDFSKAFANNWGACIDLSMRNYADHVSIEMKKLAPFLTGALMQGITPVKQTDSEYDIIDTVPYAIIRNYINNAHPQTKMYIQNGIATVAAGGHAQWWNALN